MARADMPVLANVTEPGDIALYAIVVGLTLVVGLVLFVIDSRGWGREKD